MSIQSLIVLTQKVAERRKNFQLMEDIRRLAIFNSEETAEHRTVLIATKNSGIANEDLVNAEAELKSATLAIYEETGEKKPIDKVEVKIFKRLEYDPAEVLKWCRDNAPSLLVVNKKPFEKTAVEIGAPVNVKEEAKCTIGSNLSSYLNEKGEK